MGQQWGVPVALVGLVVSDGESQRAVDAGSWELSGEVIRGAEHSGVLEVDGDGVTAQNLSSALCSAWPLFLYHDLVHAVNTGLNRRYFLICLKSGKYKRHHANDANNFSNVLKITSFTKNVLFIF